MYFRFLEAANANQLDKLPPEVAEHFANHIHQLLFFSHPAEYAACANAYPKLADKIVDSGHKYIEAGKPFSKSLMAFFDALTPGNQKKMVPALMGNALYRDDNKSFNELLQIIPEPERQTFLENIWITRVSSAPLFDDHLTTVNKLFNLLGAEGVRRAETKNPEKPFPFLEEAADSTFFESSKSFCLIAPLVPDSATLKSVLTRRYGVTEQAMRHPAMARKIRELCNVEDFANLLTEHNGLQGILLSNNKELMEEMWSAAPENKWQAAAYRTMMQAIKDRKDASIEFIMSHIAPQSRMGLVSTTIDDILSSCDNEDLFKACQQFPLIAKYLTPEEIAEVIELLPQVKPYIGDDATATEPGEGKPKHGSSQWLQLYQKGPKRWQAMLHMKPPNEELGEQSPYGFSLKRYDALLPLCKIAKDLEHTSNAELHAYKLSVLFASTEEARKYIDKYVSAVGGEPKQPLHDACLFEIPENGLWKPALWAEFLQKYPVEGRAYVAMAPAIEEALKQNKLPFPTTLKEMRHIEMQTAYKRADENPEFAELAHTYHVGASAFDKCLDLIKATKKISDKLPDITINGEDIKHPGYYMEKLAPGDPTGLILGHITDCCQSIGQAGAEYAKHGFTSQYGGFYVWRKRAGSENAATDPIVAQSWAWLSKNNALVFDSFEYDHTNKDHAKMARPFIEHFGYLAKSKGINAIRLGTGGETPKLHLPKAETSERWKDFSYKEGMDAEFDSKNQYVVTARNHEVAKKRGMAVA